MLPRIKTFIDGYDEGLGRGIPVGHVVLIAGTPGTMKTSLAYSILYNNALYKGKKGLYISLEQNKESLEEQMNSLQMRRKKVEDDLAILDLAAMRIKIGNLRGEAVMNLLKMYAKNIKRSLEYHLLVIDSVDALRILVNHKDFKVEYFRLFRWLRELKVTSFLISELPYSSHSLENVDDSNILDETKRDFLADGILLLTMDQMSPFGNQRRMRCVKMRGTAHETGYFVLDFDAGKFSATKAVA